MIKRQELLDYYYGPNGIPPEYHTIEETSDHFCLPVQDIFKALQMYDITVRTNRDNAVKVVWQILENEFGLTFPDDFEFKATIGYHGVDLFIRRSLIAVEVTSFLQSYRSETLFAGNTVIIRCGFDNLETMKSVLIRDLKNAKLKRKRTYKDDSDEGWL
jgi:hypothetical protein